MGHPLAIFLFIFIFLKMQVLRKYKWTDVFPVYGAAIRTHNLQNMSIHP